MVSRLVRENLTRRARRFNLILDDVSITHVAFSPEFTHAVEAKQVAQQIAQRAAFLVDQAIQEKQSIIVRAQGEARSAELIGEAVRTNKGFLQLRRLEAARDIAGTLSQSGNKLMLDSSSLLLNGESRQVRGPQVRGRPGSMPEDRRSQGFVAEDVLGISPKTDRSEGRICGPPPALLSTMLMIQSLKTMSSAPHQRSKRGKVPANSERGDDSQSVSRARSIGVIGYI